MYDAIINVRKLFQKLLQTRHRLEICRMLLTVNLTTNDFLVVKD